MSGPTRKPSCRVNLGSGDRKGGKLGKGNAVESNAFSTPPNFKTAHKNPSTDRRTT